MTIKIHELSKKDEEKAIQFAIEGMHFDWYLSNPFLLHTYGTYFLYHAKSQASQVLAAYHENTLVGLLIANIYDEPKKALPFKQRAFLVFFDLLAKTIFRNSAGTYEAICQKQFQHYTQSHHPDGEMLFLAADPSKENQGIGSILLKELERRECGKTLFLYTDNACSYQFYERRGFEKMEEDRIELDTQNGIVPLTCFLFSKRFPH